MASEYSIKYQGSLFWLIFWAIIFFPVALMLLATGTYYSGDGTQYRLKYNGSRFWLGFWIIVFFPISLLLLIYYGCGWVVETETKTTETIIKLK